MCMAKKENEDRKKKDKENSKENKMGLKKSNEVWNTRNSILCTRIIFINV